MKKSNIFELSKKIYDIFKPKQRREFWNLALMILASAFMETMCLPVVLPLVNLVANGDGQHSNFILNTIGNIFKLKSDLQYTIAALLLVIVTYLAKSIVVLALYKVQFSFIFKGRQELSVELVKKYLEQEYLFHVAHNIADLQRDTNSDVVNFYSTVLALIQLFTEFLVCAALFLYLVIKDWKTTIGLIILLLSFLLAMSLQYKRKLEQYGQDARIYNASTDKWRFQAFGGVKELKVTNTVEYFLNRFSQENAKYMKVLEKQQLLTNAPRPIIEGLSITILLVVIMTNVMLTGESGKIVETLAVFAVAAFRILPSFSRIMGYITTLSYYSASVDAVGDHLKLMSKNSQGEMVSSMSFFQKISVKNISFAYPDTVDPVIKNVSFDIPRNKSIALIGPSGAGKSTMADLLLGVLHAQQGQILVDDTDIFDNLSGWHQLIGYIPQTIYLLDDTIRSNVAFGVSETQIDDQRVKLALHEAQLDDFISSLEKGTETMVGERGVRLSGGQRQRIGIARALYHQPEILILDEATSALDNDTEAAVMQAIDTLQGKKTMIIIAHRLSTIKNCDIIYEVKDQTIRRRGELKDEIQV